MKFAKIRDVKSPCRGTKKSAGIDFFVPNYSEDFLKVFQKKNPTCPNDKEGFFVRPHTMVLIPSGIKCAVPEGYGLFVDNKSGVSTKKGLTFMARTIDEDYEGELHISLLNATNDAVKILWGEKIVQMILIEMNYELPEECTIEELQEIFKSRNSERGEGGFGSTGTN
jgi:dUTP pyrophosphatase